jgi:hypothetical protein
MSRRAKLLIVPLALAGLLVVLFSGAAFAAGPHGEGTACTETVSELLGLTPEEIQAQRHEGKSLVEIAAAQGVSEDVLVEAILAAKKEAIEQKIEAGTLTQEQADLCFQQMEQRISQSVNRTTCGPVDGERGKGYGRAGEGSCCDGTGPGTGPGGMNRYGRGSR